MFQMWIVWESTGFVRRSDRAGRLRGDRRVMRAAPSRDPVDAQRNIGPGPDSESIRPGSALQSRSGRESSRRTALIPRVVEQSAPQPLRWYPLVSQSGAHSACKRQAAEPVRAGDAPADQPRLAATAQPALADGGGLPVVRSTVPDGDGAGQVETAPGAVAAVRPAAEGAQEAAGAGVGEGAGVLGRATAGRDVQRGGAWQPSLPQDAEDGLPGSDAAGDRGPTGAGPAAGAARPRPGPDDQDLAQGEGGVMREPGILATLSKKTETIARLPGNLGSNPSAAALK